MRGIHPMATFSQPLPMAPPVSAGPGCFPDELPCFIDLHELATGGRSGHYVARVTGDSAVPYIMPGCLVIFDTLARPLQGDLVVCLHEGLIYVKTLELRPKLRLVSHNPTYPPMDIAENTEFLVMGVVSGSFMRFNRK